MRTRDTDRKAPESVYAVDSRNPEPRHVPFHTPSTRSGQHRSFVQCTRKPPTPRNEAAELLAEIDGLPLLVRFLVKDIPTAVAKDAGLRLLLSSVLEKIVDRMRGSPLRTDFRSRQPLASVELISSAEDLVRLPDLSYETVLRVGSLELDLLDRTAKRGDRQIDLRPREFHLLKYIMQHSEQLLTRETLLKEVGIIHSFPKRILSMFTWADCVARSTDQTGPSSFAMSAELALF